MSYPVFNIITYFQEIIVKTEFDTDGKMAVSKMNTWNEIGLEGETN